MHRMEGPQRQCGQGREVGGQQPEAVRQLGVLPQLDMRKMREPGIGIPRRQDVQDERDQRIQGLQFRETERCATGLKHGVRGHVLDGCHSAVAIEKARARLDTDFRGPETDAYQRGQMERAQDGVPLVWSELDCQLQVSQSVRIKDDRVPELLRPRTEGSAEGLHCADRRHTLLRAVMHRDAGVAVCCLPCAIIVSRRRRPLLQAVRPAGKQSVCHHDRRYRSCTVGRRTKQKHDRTGHRAGRQRCLDPIHP
ncbi:unnamed protein product [Mycena citricolor]|uniref:Uncharacterized protein n=1 Tax=Mycena citricolor TaxID=2018698 RepID=A0AAD2GZD7_9AGAR|nr:unnamed protein product [Mycena citricolor]